MEREMIYLKALWKALFSPTNLLTDDELKEWMHGGSLPERIRSKPHLLRKFIGR